MSAIVDDISPWLDEVTADDMRRIVDALYRVHRFLAVMTDLDALLERVMEESKQVAGAEASSLMLYDSATDELYFQVALGDGSDLQRLKQEVRLTLDQGIAGACAKQRAVINVDDVAKDPRFYRDADEKSQFRTRSILAVPLLDHDQLIGVLEVLNKVGDGGFSEFDAHVMQMFSNVAASAIANARLIEDNVQAERLAAIGTAVAGLSHYCKNMITGLSGSVDLIDQALDTGNYEHIRKSWPIFRRSTKRISNFVEDMLAFSKTRKPQYLECDIDGLLNDVADTFWGLLTRKQIALEIDTSRVNGRARLDSGSMYRCLLNLFTNAADAVESGTGRIWVTVRRIDNDDLEFEVADNGPGIPAKVLPRIFDPFFSTKGSRGTGLGLAVTQKIVAEHGGTIAAANRPEGGACFRIRVPQPAEPA